MSDAKKTDNKVEKVTGKVKETAGRVVGNRSLEAEGKADQTKADVKQAGEKVKDAVRSVTGSSSKKDEEPRDTPRDPERRWTPASSAGIRRVRRGSARGCPSAPPGRPRRAG